ncbi:MAG: hypothetical protein OXC84_03195 [Gammaproteobacteria bacterium]|nr:hypothetical protein [Gammaproteobacteria bacterium]
MSAKHTIECSSNQQSRGEACWCSPGLFCGYWSYGDLGPAYSNSMWTFLKYSKEKAGRRWASINETERGKILRESFEIPIIVEVLMDNGQCFIGSASVDHTALDYEGDVTFEPWMCGNRDNQTNQLTVNNLYYPNQSMARVVLMVEKMKSVSLFNPKVNDIKWNVP